MTPRVSRSRFGWSFIGLGPILAIAIYGCSQNSTVSGPDRLSTPEFVLVPGDHAGGFSTAPADAEGSAMISAATGGQLHVGRFLLTFAPGAVAQDTEVTLVDESHSYGYVRCHLAPEGIVFLAPVTLEADFSDITDPIPYDMYWRVPVESGDDWSSVGGDPTPNGRGIVTTLRHFSEYAPGKAGW